MNNNEINSKVLCNAIRKFAENPAAIENFEDYLSHHFEIWLEKYASTPDNLANEFKEFSTIEF